MVLGTLPVRLTFVSPNYHVSILRSKTRPSGVIACRVNNKIQTQLFCVQSPASPAISHRCAQARMLYFSPAVPAEARDGDKGGCWFSIPGPKDSDSFLTHTRVVGCDVASTFVEICTL